jgi:EAL domain-containing protein (putative c-di-GMP-specific phosphodiesterase class I)
VSAEGVETAGQLDMLAALGCELAQGYRFSVPLSAADTLARWLQRKPVN